MWAAFDFAILYIATLAFSDENLQLLWSVVRIGNILSKSPEAYVAWTIIILIFVGITGGFDILYSIQTGTLLSQIVADG